MVAGLFLIFAAQIAILWRIRMAIDTLADLQPHLDALKAAIDSISQPVPLDLQPIADQIDTLTAEAQSKATPAG